jgi:hypothetical protein
MFKLIRIFILLLVLLGVAAFVFLANINTIVKTGVETGGPMVLKVPVSLESSDLSLLSGSRLSGLTVGNPDGYKSTHAFKLDDIAIDLDFASVMSEKIHVKEIIIDGPHIIYEGSLSNSNIKTIVDGLTSGESEETAPQEPSEPQPEGEAQKKSVVIDHLHIKNIKVGVSNPLLGGKALTLSIPDIEKKDIGKGENISVDKIVKDLIKEINKAIVPALKKQMGNLGEGLDKLGKDLLKGDPRAKESVKKATDKLKSNLKGLFGN